MRRGAATVTVGRMIRPGERADNDVGPSPLPGGSEINTTTLREQAADPRFPGPLLLPCHQLALITGGHGIQEIDFRTYPCRPGTLLWTHPGQAVRYGGQAGLDAILVRWGAEALAGLDAAQARLDPLADIGHWQLAGEDEDAVISEVSQLVVDSRRHLPASVAADLVRHQLAVLVLRLALLSTPDLPGAGTPPIGAADRTAASVPGLAATPDAADRSAPAGALADRPGPSPDQAGPAMASTYRRLRHEVEFSYAGTRRVEDYADRIGCSVRTLTRACLATAGRSAKQVVDDRVTLQAKRLLAATDEPIADVGRRLGFPEPTNFGRFFQREVGRTPGAFRAGFGRPQVRMPGQRAGDQPRPAAGDRSPAGTGRTAVDARATGTARRGAPRRSFTGDRAPG